MIAETTSFTLEGITARPVRVEVNVTRGLPNFQVIGLPDLAVRETRERVRAALVNSGFDFPLRRITVNLAPSDLRKAGPTLDLAIAVALLAAAGEIEHTQIEGFTYAGELALDGHLRPVRGALAMAEQARSMGSLGILVAPANGPEAALAHGVDVRTIDNLAQLRKFGVNGNHGDTPDRPELRRADQLPDLADLRGQEPLRGALEVAAAGGHGMLMVGPPGSGKSLAARRLPSILPPLDGNEILEVARIASACGIGDGALSSNRPFRAPHHTVSAAGLVGGGAPARPGEVTLAHRGVLFLDELVEFSRPSLEAMRQPLEEGKVTVARAAGRMTYPADFQLIGAANPCPCGRGEHDPGCRCSEASLMRYRAALEGALTDRIDIHVAVEQPSATDLAGAPGESSASVRDRVLAARERQADRLGANRTNARATPDEVAGFNLGYGALASLDANQSREGHNTRRVLTIARTIADLADSSEVREEDVTKALLYTRRRQPTAA